MPCPQAMESQAVRAETTQEYQKPWLDSKGNTSRGGWQELGSKAHIQMGVCLWNLLPHGPKALVRTEVAASEPGLWVAKW